MLSDTFVTPLDGRRRKTKIVATVGPASRSRDRIKDLILAGVNVFRFNFSHGTHEEHLGALVTIREVSTALDIPVAILQDLSGPKLRITNIVSDFVELQDEATLTLRFAGSSATNTSSAEVVYVESVDPARSVKVGDQVFMADGSIALSATEIAKNEVKCRVIKGGRMRSRVGIAFPDSNIDLPATTDKDLRDLEWGIANKIDYVAISFVQSAQDVIMLREFMRERNVDIHIVAKIERRSALRAIDEIVAVSDGLMVARGDLGLELPLEMLPNVQRTLIEKANNSGIPVIVATQMLHSMITSVRPTRAEVSDISAAVWNGADAVMLSEETTIGEHPVEAVKFLSRIAVAAERDFEFEEYKLRLRDHDRLNVPDAVAYAACAAAIKVNAAAIIACTERGTSARLAAKYRPQQPLYGASSHIETLRRMTLYWGVTPISCKAVNTHDDELVTAMRAVQQRENLPDRSRAVITGGVAAGLPGTTSVLEIREFETNG